MLGVLGQILFVAGEFADVGAVRTGLEDEGFDPGGLDFLGVGLDEACDGKILAVVSGRDGLLGVTYILRLPWHRRRDLLLGLRWCLRGMRLRGRSLSLVCGSRW